ncbi:MAG: PAS domain-containing protein, partial [Mycobacteriales bacterium]
MADETVVLVVEDDPDQAFLIGRRLAAHGAAPMRVVYATTAAEGLAVLDEALVGCVLLDLKLPDARGLQALNRIRERHPSVPVVVLTGMDDDELGVAAVQAGAQDYLVKGRVPSTEIARAVRFSVERAGRQRAERERAAVADELQVLLEASAEGICRVDVDGRIAMMNRSAKELLGCQGKDGLGGHFHDVVGHRRVDGAPCRLQDCPLAGAAARGQSLDAVDQFFERRDGTCFIADARLRPVHQGPALQGAVLNFTDATERHRTQRRLAEREAQLAEAQKVARLGSWEWEAGADALTWSAEMHQVLGVDGDPPSGSARALEAYTSLLVPEDRGSVRQLLDRAAATGDPMVFRHRIRRPDG